MTTPKAKFAGLALIAALCAGFTLGLTAPAWAGWDEAVEPLPFDFGSVSEHKPLLAKPFPRENPGVAFHFQRHPSGSSDTARYHYFRTETGRVLNPDLFLRIRRPRGMKNNGFERQRRPQQCPPRMCGDSGSPLAVPRERPPLPETAIRLPIFSESSCNTSRVGIY